MLTSTRGIALHQIKYNDTAIIASIYTEKLGLKSYLVRGAKKKNSFFQPLSVLEMVTSHREKQDLHYIKEVRLSFPFASIPFHPQKRAIALFLSEVLYRSLREEEANTSLFQFLVHALELFDLESNCSNFHLSFLLALSQYLGFYPENEFSETKPYFDLQEGVFTSHPPAQNFIKPPESLAFSQLLNAGLKAFNQLILSAATRRTLLNALVNYYHIHLDWKKAIRSHEVLEEVFR